MNAMDVLFKRGGNNALSANPPNNVDGHQTTHGSDFYYAICAAMGASALAVAVTMFRQPRGDRIFHYLSISLLLTACVAYYSMGSDLGYAPVVSEYMRGGKVAGVTRQVFYARYIDWFVTTPLLLMDLLLTAGLPWSTILYTVFLDEVMIVTGLVGALTSSKYKWGYFFAGCVAMLAIFYELAFVGMRSAKALGSDVKKLYVSLLIVNVVIWTLYPIAWGLSEGGNVIPADSEAVFYGVLDFIAKPIFTAILLLGHSKIDINRFGLRGFTQADLIGGRDAHVHRDSHETKETTATAAV